MNLKLKEDNKEEIKEIKYLRNKIFSKFNSINNKDKIIETGDKIAIGISGGKDSNLLLEILGMQYLNPKIKFELIAIHVEIEGIGYEINKKEIEKICEKYKISFIIIKSKIPDNKKNKIEDIEDIEIKKQRCYLCSTSRRKSIIEYCEKNGINKIAFGHHLDDAAETILMNEFFCGSISTLTSKRELDEMHKGLYIIRPLITTPLRLIEEYVNIRKYPKMIKRCPFECQTQRMEMRNLLKEFKKKYPNVVESIVVSVTNVKEKYI